jgi:peptide/nickel transport system permease protein
MLTYLARRILSLVPVLLGITFLAFLLGNLAPGDPAIQLYIARTGEPPPNNAVIEEIREDLGLNDPLLVRYVRWLYALAQGDMGTSYRTGLPVSEQIRQHSGITLRLAVLGIILSVIVAVPLGALAAVYQNSVLDLGIRVTSFLGAAIPAFWLSYVLILIFSVRLHLLPVAGTGSWKHMVLPVLVISLFSIAVITRLLRASLLEALSSDYVRTARAKGLKEKQVVLIHAMKNSLIPVVTIIGTLFASLVAGAVIIETIFALPGLGRLIIDAISFRDYPIIQGFVVFTGIVFVMVNLVVDLSYLVIDPRVRLGAKGGQGE